MPSKSRSRKGQNESESVSAPAAKSAAQKVTNASIVPEKHIGAADVEMCLASGSEGETMEKDDLLRMFREEQQHARKRAHMAAAQQVLESMKPVNQRAAQLKRVLESRQAVMKAKVRKRV